ncbi:MAG: AI-2E family transporter [Methanotrichaceae archaeon]
MSSDLGKWCSENKSTLIITILSLALIFYFLSPFLDGVVLGTVFAYVGRPIRDQFKSKRRLGAFIATICIVIPIFLVLGLGMLEIANQIIALAYNQRMLVGAINSSTTRLAIPPVFHDVFFSGLQNIAGIVMPIAAGIPVFHIGRVVSLTIINFVISIPVCYFLLLDGEGFVESLIALLPAEHMEIYRRYIMRIDRIFSGIFLGTIYTSILGSVIAAFIFYAFGLPKPFALASFVFVAGMIPVLTAWVVIVPATIYRYLTFGLADAVIFLIISSSLIYIPSELLIRPYLIHSKSSIHPLLVMLSFLGGALVAGIGGFFLAPAIMGVIVGIYQIRREEMDAK